MYKEARSFAWASFAYEHGSIYIHVLKHGTVLEERRRPYGQARATAGAAWKVLETSRPVGPSGGDSGWVHRPVTK